MILFPLLHSRQASPLLAHAAVHLPQKAQHLLLLPGQVLEFGLDHVTFGAIRLWLSTKLFEFLEDGQLEG